MGSSTARRSSAKTPTAPFTYTWSAVGVGTYALTARATDDLGGVTTSLASNITVNPSNAAPTVALTQPGDGATFTAPATVNLAATASDADGTVTKIEFFNGTTKLGEDTTAPFTYTWNGLGAGTYSLTARATDDLGAVTTSLTSTISVASNTAPSVSITYPIDAAIFTWKPNITITATASDSDGTVTKVEFRDGTTLLGQDTSAPYSFTWRNVASGSHSLTARATDNGGATATSGGVAIVVLRKR